MPTDAALFSKWYVPIVVGFTIVVLGNLATATEIYELVRGSLGL